MNLQLCLTIITDSNDNIQSMIERYIPNNKVPVAFKNNLFGKELEDYLLKESYLHISMGTSALEGAKLKIPTILCDYSKSEFPEDYKYHWLYMSKGYSLADEIFPNSETKGDTLQNILNEIYDKDKYTEIGKRCYQYTFENHSLDAHVRILLKAFEETEMTVADYLNTRFSKNMKYVKPLLEKISKIKRNIF